MIAVFFAGSLKAGGSEFFGELLISEHGNLLEFAHPQCQVVAELGECGAREVEVIKNSDLGRCFFISLDYIVFPSDVHYYDQTERWISNEGIV